MKIALYTLGCKLNQAESDELKETLQNERFFIVGWQDKADIYIINACSITHGAEQGTRQIIRQARRKNSRAKIFVTGCFKQKIPGIDFFISNKNKLFKKIQESAKKNSTNIISSPHYHTLMYGNEIENRTRAFIKIQTGCDNYCSFCIIPYFRGKPKSVNAQKIIKTINQKAANGFKEIVLTGVNICKYQNIHFNAALSRCISLNLSQLVQKILNETKIQRIRFGSLDPLLINDEFIALFRDPRVMPHMHLSLQSGSDRILKLMNRKYTARQYLLLVQKIKKQFPALGFTTDVIVGFPDEQEKDFKNTCQLVKKVGFLKVHIFPYSLRRGTPAGAAPNQIAEKTKKERFQTLSKIADSLHKNFEKKMIGQTVPVLFEEKNGNFWFGYTPNYLRIKFKNSNDLKNKIWEIKIKHENLV